MSKTKMISYISTFILLAVLYFILTGMIGAGFISRYQTNILTLICINIILACLLYTSLATFSIVGCSLSEVDISKKQKRSGIVYIVKDVYKRQLYACNNRYS